MQIYFCVILGTWILLLARPYKNSETEVDIFTHSASVPSVQVRAGLEKAKQGLEKESADLSADLRSLTSAKQDIEHKKKKLEGQLNDLNSRFNESERQKNELSERVSKMTVSHTNNDRSESDRKISVGYL